MQFRKCVYDCLQKIPRKKTSQCNSQIKTCTSCKEVQEWKYNKSHNPNPLQFFVQQGTHFGCPLQFGLQPLILQRMQMPLVVQIGTD